METLRLVDVADDGQLVLMSNDGRRFVLPVDAEVRAAVRRDRARTPDDDRTERPGPREVQARIRAGADAEEVAAATGLEVEYVRRFEGPVLAERRHVAELGRALPVHRDPGSRPSSLETVVVAALADAGHDADRIQWDSRKVEGTRWDVEVFAGARVAHDGEDGHSDADTPGPVHATWRIDVATRSIEELDDTARRLTALDRRRLSPVRDRVFDIEAGRSRRQQQAGADVTASTTASILEALALQRGRRPGEARGDDGDRGSPPGRVAAAAASPRHDLHEQDSDRDDDHHGSESHGQDHPGGHEGRGARIAAFAPRRQPAEVEAPTADDGLPLDTFEDGFEDGTMDGPVDLQGPDDDRSGRSADPDARLIGGPGRTPGRGAPADGTRDFHEEFSPAPDDPATDGPAIDPSLLGELDLAAPPRAPARPVRRNGTPSGPRTVAAPSPPRRTGEDGSRQDAPAPQPSAPAAEQADAPAARRTSKRRRAAVPSWDDIVFGARVDDD